MSLEDATVIVELPEEHRDAFKAPLGEVWTDTAALLDEIDGPVITIGDVVSFHCYEADRTPAVAVVDGRTKRTAVDPEIEAAIEAADVHRITAVNPPGTLTVSLIEALEIGIGREDAVQIIVDGEEDLAAIPAILLAPDGSAVLYGQPDEGVVYVPIDESARARAIELIEYLAGDRERLKQLRDG